jgi:hypothetical protein
VDTARRADRWAATAAAGLAVSAVAVGLVLNLRRVPVHANAAPIFGDLHPHAGVGTPVAVAVATGVVLAGPRLAAGLPWRRALVTSYGCAVAWTLALALVDGWHAGVAGRLTTPPEYLSEVDRVTDVAALLRGFTARILDTAPDPWTTHVAGHPPGALLVFVALDRLGLRGGGWAGLVCVLAGATVAVTVPVALRALGGEAAARPTLPFLALLPGAVWLGVSADAVFTAVTAAAVAALALGAVRPSWTGVGWTLLGGALLGLGAFLSYGLVLMAVVAAAVAVAARPRWRWTALATAGAAAVWCLFAALGFSWLDGYHLVVERYYQGIAAVRPYPYWVWANLACLLAATGPVLAPVVWRVAASAYHRWRAPPPQVALPVAAIVSIVLADLSGLSKGETERIWLPFAVWLVAGTELVPAGHRRGWLVAQAATALVVNHLVWTVW